MRENIQIFAFQIKNKKPQKWEEVKPQVTELLYSVPLTTEFNRFLCLKEPLVDWSWLIHQTPTTWQAWNGGRDGSSECTDQQSSEKVVFLLQEKNM